MRRKLENLESWFGNLENTGNTRVREFLSIKKNLRLEAYAFNFRGLDGTDLIAFSLS